MDIECDIVVNSDSKELIKLVAENGKLNIESIMRDESLGGDTVDNIDVINNCLSIMEERYNKSYG